MEGRRLLTLVIDGDLTDPQITPEDLAQSLVGPGIQISNVSFTGDETAAGMFREGLSAGIGISGGIVLASGSVHNALGPNVSDATTSNLGLSGDPDLGSLIPQSVTYDATVLEFDFEAAGGTLSFQYVFASEEYAEYVGSSYNDVFAFFLDGTNIALIPGTTTPVAINNVNSGNPEPFGGGDPVPPSNPQFHNSNDRSVDGVPTPFDIEYDGFTDVFQATAELAPGLHHIKLAIADASDALLDSAVFLKGASFVSATADLSLVKSDDFDPVAAGGQITYTLTVTNDGPDEATGVTVTDDLPAGATFVSASSSQGPTPVNQGGNVIADLGALAVGATATVVITVTADEPGTLVNQAYLTANESDPDLQDNWAVEETTASSCGATYTTDSDFLQGELENVIAADDQLQLVESPDPDEQPPASGTWSVIFDSGFDDQTWGFVNWTSFEPGDSLIRVLAASSADGVEFGDFEEAVPGGDLDVADGRFLQLFVIFLRGTPVANGDPNLVGPSPVLFEISIVCGESVFDFGDAPSPYPTRLEDGGARHAVDPGFCLGSVVDAEPNGQPDQNALGDDLNTVYPGLPFPPGDEDGVTFLTPLRANAVAEVEVAVTAAPDMPPGYVFAWVDFNADGDWDDSFDDGQGGVISELVLRKSLADEPGSSPYRWSFAVPDQVAISRPTFARFRLSLMDELGPAGFGCYGEVEDYLVTIGPEGQTEVPLEPAAIAAARLAEAGPQVIDLRPAEPKIVFLGSEDGDDFHFSAGATVHRVEFNGQAYEYPVGEVTTIEFDGGGGDNRAVFSGSERGESAALWPGYGEFRGLAVVTVTSCRTITAQMGEGFDTVQMHGSADAAEAGQLSARPGRAEFKPQDGSGFLLNADGFEVLEAFAGAGPSEAAYLYDSPDDDHFYADPTQAILSRPGEYELTALGFRYAHAYATAGGRDTAELHDSSGDDVFLFYKDQAKLYGETAAYSVRAKHFEQITAYSENGRGPAGDVAYLFDSKRYDEFTGSPAEGKMELGVRTVDGVRLVDAAATAAGFDYVHAYSRYGGRDTAELFDSPGDDTLIAKPEWTKLYNDALDPAADFFLRAKGFAVVHGQATAGGRDRAHFYDSPGRDVFSATPEYAQIYGLDVDFHNRASGFAEVYGYAAGGGSGIVDPETADWLFTAGW